MGAVEIVELVELLPPDFVVFLVPLTLELDGAGTGVGGGVGGGGGGGM